MNKKRYYWLLAFGIVLSACHNRHTDFDATGTFEATEITVSAEANGKIMSLDLEEGDRIQAGSIVGYIDSTQLYLRKKQLGAGLRSIDIRKPDIQKQIISGDVTLPAEVPKAVAEVILACLRKDPEARPTVHEVLEMDWLKGEVMRKVQAVPGAQMKPVQSATGGRPSNPMLKLPALLISNRTTKQFNGLVQLSRRIFARRHIKARKSDVH